MARMTRIALLAVVLSACTGSTYYPSGQPVYATQTTQTTNGSSTTTSTTTFQSASYEEPQPEPQPEPPPPPPEPEPMPVSHCDQRDNREMCIALGVIVDVGDILLGVERESCRRASKELNRYADGHEREIRTLLRLEHTQTPMRLQQFQQRHAATAAVVMTRALDLEARCDGDDRVVRALRRIGFKR